MHITRTELEAAVKQRLARLTLPRAAARSRLVDFDRIPAQAAAVPLSVFMGDGALTEAARAAVDEFIEECKRKGVPPSEVVFL